MPDDLDLQPSDGARVKKRKPRAEQTPQEKIASSSPVVRTEGAFQMAYQETWRIPVVLNHARDRAILKRLIDQLGEDLVRSLIPDFFRAVVPPAKGGDPIVSRSRWSNVMDFGYHAQYLLLKRQRGATPTERTANNVAEITKAMGKGKRCKEY